MSRLHDGFQLLVGELLAKTRGGLRKYAAGSCNLDDVGAVAHAFADGSRAIVRAGADTGAAQEKGDIARHAVSVAMSAMYADAAGSGNDAGAGNDPPRNPRT